MNATDILKNTTTKGLPALGGGLVARFLDKKAVEMTAPEAGKEASFLNTIAPLAGGFVGLFLLNKKDDSMSYAGAGMIAVSGTDTLGRTEALSEYLGLADENLASSIDELLGKKS